MNDFFSENPITEISFPIIGRYGNSLRKFLTENAYVSKNLEVLPWQVESGLCHLVGACFYLLGPPI